MTVLLTALPVPYFTLWHSVTTSLSLSGPPSLSPGPPMLFPSDGHGYFRPPVLCIYQSVSVLSIFTCKTLVFLPIGNAGGQLNSHHNTSKLSTDPVTHRGWLGFPGGDLQLLNRGVWRPSDELMVFSLGFLSSGRGVYCTSSLGRMMWQTDIFTWCIFITIVKHTTSLL